MIKKAIRNAVARAEREGYVVESIEEPGRGRHYKLHLRAADGFQFFFVVSGSAFDGCVLLDWMKSVKKAERETRELRTRRTA